jgi:pimeloyl-ACP methyl ester carboxylesterase
MPVTLAVGERDAKFQATAAEMARELRSAEVVVVPGVGHAVHLEAPAAISDVIARPPATLGM